MYEREHDRGDVPRRPREGRRTPARRRPCRSMPAHRITATTAASRNTPTLPVDAYTPKLVTTSASSASVCRL